MSEKRFELYGNNYLALDDNVEEKTYYLNDDESIDLLVAKMNELAEENMRLRGNHKEILGRYLSLKIQLGELLHQFNIEDFGIKEKE